MTELVATVGILLGLSILGGIVWTALRQRRHARRRLPS
jgi:hypothetical protein